MMLLFLGLVSISTLIDAKCPASYLEYNDFCYLQVQMTATWDAAESLCNIQGGHLVSIHSQDENNFLLSKIMKVKNPVNKQDSFTSVFIGAHLVNKQWQWSDGTPFDFNYFDDTKDNPNCSPTNPNNVPYCSGTIGTLVTSAPSDLAPYAQGHWFSIPNTKSFTSTFICKIPPCDANNQSPPSVLSPNQTLAAPSAVYLQTSDSWFFGAGMSDENPAETICNTMGGHLPSVHNAFENTELTAAMQDFGIGVFFYFDFGLKTDTRGKNWKFTDGSTLTYTNWATGHPINSSKQLVTYIQPYTQDWYSEHDDPLWPRHLGCQFKRTANYCQ